MSSERPKVRLTPPPRPDRNPRVDSESGPSRVAVWLTTLVFVALAGVAVAVFTVLPEWVGPRETRRVEEVPVEEVPVEEVPVEEVPVEEVPASPRPAPPPPPVPSPPPVLPPPVLPPPAPEPADEEFVESMSRGLAALDREDFEAAVSAFEKARALDPDSRPPVDGLVRAEAGLARLRIEEHRDRARAFEAEEKWREALAQYETVLEIDPTLLFAQEGRSRSHERSRLVETLAFHVDHAERLSTPSVLEEASIVLAMARETEPAGPRHRRQVEELSRIVEIYSTPVPVEIVSDNSTEVLVYKVGRLGAFNERILELRPGSYTVVGSRRGYRDVRRQLVVEPGGAPEPLVVRCEEEI